MSFSSSAWCFLGRVFARDGVLGRARGARRQLLAIRAAAELRASENRFRLLFDAAPVAIAITRNGVLLYVNEASVTLLGCASKNDLIGHEVSDFVAPPQLDAMQKRIERRAQGLEEPLIYQSQARRTDGVTVPLRIEVTQLELPDGAATLAFAFDLRVEHAAQAQRNLLLARARRAALFAERLQQITAALAAAHSGAAVADLIIGSSVAALEARAGALSLPVAAKNGGFDLEIIAVRGYGAQVLEDYARLPVAPDSPFPAARGFLENRAIWLENPQQIEREFPEFAAILAATPDRAVCVLPLEFENRTLGVLNLAFAQPQEFGAETRAFMLTLAAQCAAALERARLLSEAQGAARLQRESLALLDTLLDTAPVGFAFFDLQGRYVLVNRALSLINRTPVAQHLGRTIADITPSVGARLEAMIQRVITSGEPSGETEILGVSVGGTEGESGSESAEILHALVAFYPVRGAGNITLGGGEKGSEILGVGSVVIDISARVNAERDRVQLLGELEIERARFEAILQQMPSGVVIAEAPSGRLVLGNPQVAEIWRQPFVAVADIGHYGVYRGFHFDGRPLEPSQWPLARAIEKGETVRGEEILAARGDGSQGVVRLNAAPIRDRDGHITAAVVVFDDVTARAKSEAAQRFLAAAGSALVATLDERQCYQQLAQLCAPGVADWCLVAVPGEDGLLSQIAIAHAENSDASADAQADAIAGEFQAALQGDPQLPFELGNALREALGEALRDSSREAGEKGLENPRDEATNAAFSDLLRGGAVFGPEAVSGLESLSQSAAYRRFVAGIGAKSALVMPLQARERVLGLMIWVSAASGRTYDDDDLELASEIGRRAALVATGARLFREAEIARDEAQNANRAKDEFLAVVSHELRTPLTPIMGWLELLRSPGVDDAMRAQAYEVIERNARAQAQLINDILDVSRITTGKLRLELRPLGLREVVARAVEMLRPTAREKNIDLHFDFRASQEIVARADANRLPQIVWNLVQNALKFTPSGGAVRVSLSQDEASQRAVLEVADNGAGIEAEFLPFVFDRFRQADSSSTRRAGGLGLGLAIVDHIVAGHGGRVSVASAGSGQGATFRVELPLEDAPDFVPDFVPDSLATRTDVAPENTGKANGQPALAALISPARDAATAPTSAPEPEAAPRRDLAQLRVIVVDDDPDTRAMLQTLLEKNGARVAVAALAPEALALWRSARPELLICDIAMPTMDGYELRRALQSEGFVAPSIALSAYTAPADVQKALTAGFDIHLAKPVDAEKLLAAIAELIGIGTV